MARLAFAALIFLTLPAAAWSKPPDANDNQSRSFVLPRLADHQRFAGEGRKGQAEIAPNTHFGFGIFGLKSEKSYLRPVTVREIEAPKQRRAAVGLSLKF